MALTPRPRLGTTLKFRRADVREHRFFVVLRAKLNYYRSPEAYQQGVAPYAAPLHWRLSVSSVSLPLGLLVCQDPLLWLPSSCCTVAAQWLHSGCGADG